MRVLLRDVHHFLYDAPFSPRPGENFHIRTDVRARALDALEDGAPARSISWSGTASAASTLSPRSMTPQG